MELRTRPQTSPARQRFATLGSTSSPPDISKWKAETSEKDENAVNTTKTFQRPATSPSGNRLQELRPLDEESDEEDGVKFDIPGDVADTIKIIKELLASDSIAEQKDGVAKCLNLVIVNSDATNYLRVKKVFEPLIKLLKHRKGRGPDFFIEVIRTVLALCEFNDKNKEELKKLGIAIPLQNLNALPYTPLQDECKILIQLLGITIQTSLGSRLRSFTVSAAQTISRKLETGQEPTNAREKEIILLKKRLEEERKKAVKVEQKEKEKELKLQRKKERESFRKYLKGDSSDDELPPPDKEELAKLQGYLADSPTWTGQFGMNNLSGSIRPGMNMGFGGNQLYY